MFVTLLPAPSTQDYDPAIIPVIYDEFSSAAFRMGHSQVPNYIFLMNKKYEVIYRVPLHSSFSNASLLYHVSPKAEIYWWKL